METATRESLVAGGGSDPLRGWGRGIQTRVVWGPTVSATPGRTRALHRRRVGIAGHDRGPTAFSERRRPPSGAQPLVALSAPGPQWQGAGGTPLSHGSHRNSSFSVHLPSSSGSQTGLCSAAGGAGDRNPGKGSGGGGKHVRQRASRVFSGPMGPVLRSAFCGTCPDLEIECIHTSTGYTLFVFGIHTGYTL